MTSVVGVLKNIVTTVLGALVFSDWIYHPAHALSLGVSTIGAVLYAYLATSTSTTGTTSVGIISDISQGRDGVASTSSTSSSFASSSSSPHHAVYLVPASAPHVTKIPPDIEMRDRLLPLIAPLPKRERR